MPVETMIVVGLIVAVFTAFGATLAYGDYQTRRLKREPEAGAPSGPDEVRWLDAA